MLKVHYWASAGDPNFVPDLPDEEIVTSTLASLRNKFMQGTSYLSSWI
jgi:hypothetical protein